MFRRQANITFNSRRWVSHHTRPRKLVYTLTSGAAFATSVAVVAAAAATVAGQKYIEGSSIHNDAPATSISTVTSEKMKAGTARVGGANDNGDEELKLMVWGSNR